MPKNIHHLTIGGQPAAAGGQTAAPVAPAVAAVPASDPPAVAAGGATNETKTTGPSTLAPSSTNADVPQGPLHRNDSKKFLDNKSQSVSSKPRPPPLNVSGVAGPAGGLGIGVAAPSSLVAPSLVGHDPLSNGLAAGSFKPIPTTRNDAGGNLSSVGGSQVAPSAATGAGGGGSSGGGGSGGGGTAGTKLTVEQLKRQIDSTDCTDEQKANIHKFLDLREQIGELNDEALNVEGELGSGNGGVVLKCRHRKLDIVMAKKVRTFFLYSKYYKLKKKIFLKVHFFQSHSKL